jgi:hypothetical protein
MSCQPFISSERAPARELAQRQTGPNEVALLWHQDDERVELEHRDCETGLGFAVDVAPARAIDAFFHPYASAAGNARYIRALAPHA